MRSRNGTAPLTDLTSNDAAKEVTSFSSTEDVKWISEATGTLALASSLMAGAAYGSLLAFEGPLSSWTECIHCLTLCASAALSTYTVSFTLLECYYIEATAGALRRLEGGPRFETAAPAVEAAVESFESMRGHARNAMWAGTILMLISCGARILSQASISLTSVLCFLLMLLGALAVVRTVAAFRAVYRPLLTSISHKGKCH